MKKFVDLCVMIFSLILVALTITFNGINYLDVILEILGLNSWLGGTHVSLFYLIPIFIFIYSRKRFSPASKVSYYISSFYLGLLAISLVFMASK